MALPLKPSPEEVRSTSATLLPPSGISSRMRTSTTWPPASSSSAGTSRRSVIVIELSENGPVDVRSGVPMPPV